MTDPLEQALRDAAARPLFVPHGRAVRLEAEANDAADPFVRDVRRAVGLPDAEEEPEASRGAGQPPALNSHSLEAALAAAVGAPIPPSQEA